MYSSTSFQGALLIAAIEAIYVVKFLSDVPISSSSSDHPTYRVSFVIGSALAINCGLILVYITLIYSRFISPLRGISGPRWWAFRIALNYLRRRAQGELLLQAAQETPNDGIVALRGLSGTRLLVTKPQILVDLLVHRNDEFTKPKNLQRVLRRVVGDGLVIAEGDQHRLMRKKTGPAFTSQRIKGLYPMMWKNSLTFTSVLEANIRDSNPDAEPSKSPSTGTVEITHWTSMATLNIILEAVLGHDFDIFGNSENPLVKAYNVIIEPSKEMLAYIFMSTWFSHRLTKIIMYNANEAFENATATLKEICLQLTRDRREAIGKGLESVDILSQLINSNSFSDDELASQLLTLLTAGHDTTAHALSWACYLLALDSSHQNALRSEVRRHLPSTILNNFASPTSSVESEPSPDVAYAIMERLPLLNGVIAETFRLYPTVPATIRAPTDDTSLAGIQIPKDSEIVVSPWVINRSCELWGPDASVFRPERWITPATSSDDPDQASEDQFGGKLNNTGSAKSNYDFMTFLHGPHSCIGANFARASLRCLLVTMVLQYEWTLDMNVDDVFPGGAISIKPQNGLFLKLKIIRG
ncbi:cytochrome P450 [Hypoxylon trugodes]|uniref:cytochrome P450 n=1 Tax=Hypoxylon trugodes TaxID=326681 RepID=UPI0021964D02|nr:cytochrome P450 [Hypoxylon trugodes]KAI1388532.1 cytochrome P450 [Hypoxylon trugodes]